MQIKTLFIRSQDIFSDSRILRYEEWFKKNDKDYKILGWDRNNSDIKRQNTNYCRINAGFNLGLKGIKYRVKWNLFLLYYLFKTKSKYDVIHACDFDTIWPAIFMKIFGKKVIFDIFDWFSDEVRTGKKIIDTLINYLEKKAVKYADITILCEKGRLKQIGIMPPNYIVIPNIPSDKICISDIPKERKDKYRLCVGYVGGFYKDRGLLELLEAIKNFPDIKLCIAGFGDIEIEQSVRLFSELYPNIIFHGRVEHAEALKIMGSADILYAMYYKVNRNNIFAAPNKFYESIFLRRPIITTEGTLVGEKVKECQSGYVIEEGIHELMQFFIAIERKDLENFSQSLGKASDEFSDCFKKSMENYELHVNRL